MLLLLHVSWAPHSHIVKNLFKDHSWSEEFVIEDHRVACFPNVPENEKHHIELNTVREGEVLPQHPGERTIDGVCCDANERPHIYCSRALSEDVYISFQDSGAIFAERLIPTLDIPVEHGRSGVQPAMMQQPSKELHLGWKFDTPNAHRGWVWLVALLKSTRYLSGMEDFPWARDHHTGVQAV